MGIYTPVYLRKLWTVYEMASLLTINPQARLWVVPTFLTKMILTVASANWLIYLSIELSQMYAPGFDPGNIATELLTVGLFSLVFFFIGRRWAIMMADMALAIQE